MRSNSSSITIGDTPAVGSSSISTSGRVISARPIATCWRWPPDSSPAVWRRFSSRTGNRSNTRSMLAEMSSRRRKAPISRFSWTVMVVKTLPDCGTKAIPSFTRSCGVRRAMDSPASRTSPSRSRTMPNRAFIAVDLPAPFGPTITAISPLSTETVQPRRMSAPPYPPCMPSPVRWLMRSRPSRDDQDRPR